MVGFLQDQANMKERHFICLKCGSIKTHMQKNCWAINNRCNKCKSPCPKCCNKIMIMIDSELIHIILELNKKKYKTVSCCVGHGSNRLFHIYFKKPLNKCPDPPYPFVLNNNSIILNSEYHKQLQDGHFTLLLKWATELRKK